MNDEQEFQGYFQGGEIAERRVAVLSGLEREAAVVETAQHLPLRSRMQLYLNQRREDYDGGCQRVLRDLALAGILLGVGATLGIFGEHPLQYASIPVDAAGLAAVVDACRNWPHYG